MKPTFKSPLLLVLFFISCSNEDHTTEPENKEATEEFVIFSNEDYPEIPKEEILISNQRFLGGTNASDSNDGSQNAPWASFNKALQELCASKTWYCLNIASDIAVNDFIDTKFYGGGPGTPSQYVYIRSLPSLSIPVTITLNARVEIDGQQNWLWYGFNMKGSEGINLGQDLRTNHHTIRNISGVMTGEGGDNHGFFQALNSNADYFGVFNCYFKGPGIDGVHGNTSNIIAFGISHMRIENNIFTNAPSPFYFKHSNKAERGAADIHFKNNFQQETSIGESCFFAGRAQGGIFEISNNIFASNVKISNGGGSEQPEGHFISHNTFLSNLILDKGNDPVINATLENNIIIGDLELLRYSNHINTNISDYELIGGRIYYQSNNYTLSQWQENAVPSGQDKNSVTGLPVFNGSINPIDFKLASNSLGKNLASEGGDIGANVDYVGTK
ncbi:hypothetical protein [uncultured Algibacter sp.]|uniref:hypothetical protein n=1 Tax=uncultured Algibacter sp. TaxID=298659 RepID=UPI002613B282|nr:hypothetical protein [uncultured Algibacter sp.]